MSEAFDMTASIIPRSDQLNAEDLLTGPRLVTITEVKRGNDEQPVNIVTAEFGPGRPYKPSKTMRRVLVAAWGADAAAYVGRRLMIYRDPEITFGKDKVGGIRISAMSHIPSRLSLALTVTRGRRAPFVVEPLPDGPQAITKDAAAEFEARIAAASTTEELGAIGADLKACDLGGHRERLQSAWRDRNAAIKSAATSEPAPPDPTEPVDMVSQINAALTKLIGDDLTAQQDYLSAWKGEPVDSPADLTADDAVRLLAELESEAQK
jgi:hypothetical protein